MASVISAGTTSGTSLNLTGDTSGQLQLQTNGTTPALTIDTSQNVGIGTTSPGSYAGFKTLALNGTTGGVVDFLNNGTREGSIYNSGSNLTIKTFTASPILFATNSAATQLTLDTSGNLGLGVTPSAWNAGKVIQIGSGGSLWNANSTTDVQLGSNYYYNGGFIYSTTNAATRFTQNAGVFAWHNAPSGTAGNAITFTQAMTLDASGRLQIGGTTADGILTLGSSSYGTGAIYQTTKNNGNVMVLGIR